MGGERETTVQSKAATQSTDIQGQGGQKIRIHEAKGEVHFHDDKEKLKVAIPTAKYWAKWNAFRDGQVNRLSYEDPTNGTNLLIERLNLEDAVVSITKSKKRPTWAALDAFAAGR